MARPRIVSRFDMLPIRWRLAVTSAILTFAILLAFALVIGFFTEREMRSDFDDEIRQNADLIHDRVRIEQTIDGAFRIAGREELVELAVGRRRGHPDPQRGRRADRARRPARPTSGAPAAACATSASTA